MKPTIGIFSASSPISASVPVRYLRGKQYLEQKGHHVIDGSLYGKSDYYRSGSIRERVDEFNRLLYDPEVDILMSAIGGFNTNSILPYIDYDYLKRHPKIVVGYSDTTALLLAVYAKTGLTTYYGPALAPSFGEFPPFVDWTYNNFEAVLLGKTRPYAYETPLAWTDEYVSWAEQCGPKEQRPNQWCSVIPGKAEGRLIGGNLNTLSGIFGTPYMPEIKEGDILLLEDSLLDAATTERSLSHLKLAGVFDKVGGIILGKHELFDDQGTDRKPYEILLEILGDTRIPILADFDCCHTHPMLTMPIGGIVRMDVDKNHVVLMNK